MRRFARNGFTLIEMLIAMTIFVVFMGVLINSYSSIVRGQREANDYRILYSEARNVFEIVIQEFRDGMIDYANVKYGFGCNPSAFSGGISDVYIVSKDGRSKTRIFFEEPKTDENGAYGVVKMAKGRLLFGEAIGKDPVELSMEATSLNSADVGVKDFKVYVYPFVDPYDAQYVEDDGYQFHPKVTVIATFEKRKSNGEMQSVTLQTSVSSRIYNQVYAINKCAL